MGSPISEWLQKEEAWANQPWMSSDRAMLTPGLSIQVDYNKVAAFSEQRRSKLAQTKVKTWQKLCQLLEERLQQGQISKKELAYRMNTQTGTITKLMKQKRLSYTQLHWMFALAAALDLKVEFVPRNYYGTK